MHISIHIVFLQTLLILRVFFWCFSKTMRRLALYNDVCVTYVYMCMYVCKLLTMDRFSEGVPVSFQESNGLARGLAAEETLNTLTIYLTHFYLLFPPNSDLGYSIMAESYLGWLSVIQWWAFLPHLRMSPLGYCMSPHLMMLLQLFVLPRERKSGA